MRFFLTVRVALAAFAFALAVVGCEDSTSPPPPQGMSGPFAFVTTTDFQTGSASVIWSKPGYPTDKNVASIHSDAVARFYDGLIYVVNRFGGDNIQVLDPSNGFSTVRQFSVGNGSDPHDIVFVSNTKAYVSRYEHTDVWIVDPSTGAQVGSVDLSAFADADGIPEMDHLAIVGDYLFVTLQWLDRNTQFLDPVGMSFTAVVDTKADTLVDTDAQTSGIQAISMTGVNPFSDIEVDPATGKLYVACVNSFGVQDGGVDVIDPVAFTSEGFMLTEASAHGDITDVEMVTRTLGFAIISDANFNNKLISFNPQTGALIGTVYAPGGFVLQDVELSPDGELYLTDRSPTAPGIRIFDVATGQEKVALIDVGLPPFDITFGTTQ